jgi:hypothetical protein
VNAVDQPIAESATPSQLDLRLDAERRADAALIPDGDLLETPALEQGHDLGTYVRKIADVRLPQGQVRANGDDETASP